LKTRGRKTSTREELADSTSLLIVSFTYMLTICWVVPVAPMIITWILDLTFSSFMIIWTSGLPFLSLAWYCFFKTRERKR